MCINADVLSKYPKTGLTVGSLLKHIGQVKTYIMGRTRRNCPVFGCGSSNLARLSNHLAQAHNMDSEERRKWLKWSKIGICIPLKDTSEKDLHMANTLERLVNLQEEMAANFNNFLRVQRTRRKRKSKRAKQTC